MEFLAERLQFLDLTDANETEQSLIEKLLFTSKEPLQVPWCTSDIKGLDDGQKLFQNGNTNISECSSSDFDGKEPIVNDTRTDKNYGKNEYKSKKDVKQYNFPRDHVVQKRTLQAEKVFPCPPNSVSHIQMYPIVPSLPGVFVPGVTAGVGVHPSYVSSVPPRYGHQMGLPSSSSSPQQRRPSPKSQGTFPRDPSESERLNAHQRQCVERKCDYADVANVENYGPPTYRTIQPIQPYYLQGAPANSLYVQPAVVPVYSSHMFNPYPSPAPLVYRQPEVSPGDYPEMNCEPCMEKDRGGYNNNGESMEENPLDSRFEQPLGSRVENPMENVVESEPFEPERTDAPESFEKSVQNESANQCRNFESSFSPVNDQVVKSNPQKHEHLCYHTEVVVKLPKKKSTYSSEIHVSSAVKKIVSNNLSFSNCSPQNMVNYSNNGSVTVDTENSNSNDDNCCTSNSQDVKMNEHGFTINNDNDDACNHKDKDECNRNHCRDRNNSEEEKPADVIIEISSGRHNVKSNQVLPMNGIRESISEAVAPSNESAKSSAPTKSWASLFNSSMKYRPLARVSPQVKEDFKQVANIKPDVSSASDNSPSPTVSDKFLADRDLRELGDFLCSYSPDHKIVSLQPRGLTNRNNWCYVNAILQSLIACPPFYNLLKALPVVPKRKRSSETLIIDNMVDFVNEFGPLPAAARIGKREKSARNKEENTVEIVPGPAFEPLGIYKILDKVRGESSFNIEGRQEDAEEFLSCLLNGLSDEMFEIMKAVDSTRSNVPKEEPSGSVNGGGEDDAEWNVIGPKNKSSVTRRTVCGRTPIADIFRGQLRSRVQRAGDQSTDNVQPFFTLQLDIEKAASVKEALELLVGRDQLEGVTCSKTHREVEAWTQTTLEDLPVVLILHLKCFDYKPDGCSKIIKSVDFPIDLKIDAKLMSVNRNKYSSKQRNYKLVAVVYHDGKEASKGHYVTDAYHVGYGCWIRYDDGAVRSVPESFVLKPRAPRMPYLLYYRRGDTVSAIK